MFSQSNQANWGVATFLYTMVRDHGIYKPMRGNHCSLDFLTVNMMVGLKHSNIQHKSGITLQGNVRLLHGKNNHVS
jgi:hypothetical protein